MHLSNRPNTQLFLDRLTRRSLLSGEEQEAIINLPAHAEQVQPNRDFVPLGSETDHACLVVAGLVGRFGQNWEGKRQITAIHIPGDMADLHSVVQPRASSALQALSVATILKVPHDAIRSAMARYPALAEALWRDCMVDASILSEWVVNVGRRDARARVAHLLCELAMRLGAATADGLVTFQLSVTQEHLADATGLTPVHVNRTLMSLRASGLVELHSRSVHIPDWDALVEVGEFDSLYLQEKGRPEERLRIVQPT